MKMLLTFATVLLALQASADHHEMTVSPECTAIVDQCKAAGFMPGEHKNGKGLWMDCVKVVAKGGTVAGVTVAKADAEKCIATHKEHRKEKKAHKN